ncbi:MAG TPA: 4-hydroxyphenylpyruvate dioxygenase [Candidatus Krumholzibacteria bacterium]|nr:4-hydroxyphenylpyruvate dioxygenase [Candidatus Krumholzibacteria bacterium]
MKPPFKLLGFDHVTFAVGNAKQAAVYYQSVFGFDLVGYRGLEQGDRQTASYVLRQNHVTFVLNTPYTPSSSLNNLLAKHGDGATDIAFAVDDAVKAWEHTTKHGAKNWFEPRTMEDEGGKVILSGIHTYGDVTHTFVQREGYKGVFLPGYAPAKSRGEVRQTGLLFIDHIVGNQPDSEMEDVVRFYENIFGFHRLWTVDDKDISTEYTALRSVVVADDNENVKMPINEPASGLKKSQIQEYVEFNSGAGVQHIAMSTNDIIGTIKQLTANGAEFLTVPGSYYDELPKRVGDIDEEIPTLRKLGILVDRDDSGYLLQLFTKPVQDRPTLFFELIQRKNARSFGKGNFKALFESIEREQARRGTL